MYARAYVRIWTLRSWYNNSTSQWRVKIETRPFYRKKIQILKNMAVKPCLPWYISRRLYEGPNKYYWGKVAEFGGHSLNGFEVIQLFSEGSSKALPPTPANVWIGLITKWTCITMVISSWYFQEPRITWDMSQGITSAQDEILFIYDNFFIAI